MQLQKRRWHYRERAYWESHKQPVLRRDRNVMARPVFQKATLVEVSQRDCLFKP